MLRLAEVIREYRYAKRVPQSRMAELLGFTGPTLSNIETGHMPSGRNLAAMLRWVMAEDGDLSDLVVSYRWSKHMEAQEFAAMLGWSAATQSRFESGKPLNEANVRKLLGWMLEEVAE